MVAYRADDDRISEKVKGAAETMIQAVQPWYEGNRSAAGEVKTNVMCAGLYISDFLGEHFPLTPTDYLTKSQVKGAGGPKIREILAQHDEGRMFTSEGGRTSRATVDHANQLAVLVNRSGVEAGVDAFSALERQLLASMVQHWFVIQVRHDFFGRQQVSVAFDSSWSVRAVVAAIIAAGRDREGNAAGAIAQHLVGAKLQIRFPDEAINVESYTTADQQTGRAGDYQIGDTAIHVTMAPGEKVFRERCAHNLRQGFRPRVLVPEDRLTNAYVHADDADMTLRVAIQSIEDFVGTSIEELAGFSQAGVRSGIRHLLELYNERIEQAEADLSLKIEIPENL